MLFESRVDKTKLDTDSVLTFTIVARGPFRSSPRIQLPDLTGFEIVSQAQRFNMMTQKGQQQVTSEVQLLLRPTEPGKRTLGACQLAASDKTYTTQPIEIEVTPGTKKPQEKGLPEEWRRLLQRGRDITL